MTERSMETMAEAGAFGRAVSEETYRTAFAKGAWADDPPKIAGIGHNAPNDDDAMEA